MTGPNQRLRAAMAAERVDVDKVGQKTGVDPKTVQRWLQGRVPHTRHRWAVAALLDEDPDYLWPPQSRGEQGMPADAELVAAYAHRADVPTAVWWDALSGARRQIDLVAYAMLFLFEQHAGLAKLLERKCVESCRVRVALADPTSQVVADRDREEGLGGGLIARIRTSRLYFGVLDSCPGLEIRSHRTPMYNSIFRFDDQMLVTPHLYGVPGYGAPLLHLRRKGSAGIFDSFAANVEAIWDTAVPAPPLAAPSEPEAEAAT